MSSTTDQRTEFRRFLAELKAEPPLAIPIGEVSWSQMITHISQEGRPVEIDNETWWEFLDLLPRRWMSGSEFAFAKGADCFRLFWEDRGRYFARQLTESETVRFCQLSGAKRNE